MESSLAAVVPSACPRCRSPLSCREERLLLCSQEQLSFRCIDDIWRCLLPEDEERYRRFLAGYRRVRAHEGRAFGEEAYRQLPFGVRGPLAEEWGLRARSYGTLLRRVVPPLQRSSGQTLAVLDVGAGNCWLAHRLASRGHRVAALDLSADGEDGLGARRHYPTSFMAVQASFDHLPYVDGTFDLVIFNGSLHYSSSYSTTLGEAIRVLTEGGRAVVMDSPIYRREESGRRMVSERSERFERDHGVASLENGGRGFLTWSEIDSLGEGLGLDLRIVRPAFGLIWHLRSFLTRRRLGRETARFALLVAHKKHSASLRLS
jgi:SAM-dependent methyltransferase